MASGARLSEEAGESGSGEIVVASVNQEETPEAGVVGGEIRAASSNQETGEARSLDDEIGAASANQETGEAGGLGGEIGAASANQETREAGDVGVQIGVASLNQVNGDAGAVSVEIGAASANQETGEAGDLGGEIGAASANQETREAGDVGGQIGVASLNQVNGDAGGISVEIGVASVNQVNGDAGGVSVEIGVASVNQVNGDAGGVSVGIGVACANQVTGDAGDVADGIGVASANRVTREPGGLGGEIGAASANQVTGDAEGVGGEIGVTSANQVTGKADGVGGEIGVTSANRVTGKADGVGGDIGVASANRVTGDAEGVGGEIGFASLNQVTWDAEDVGGEIGVASSNQVTGEAEGVSCQIGALEKQRWAETKVYRRRPKGEKNKGVLSEPTTIRATTTLIDNGNRSQNDKIHLGEVNTHESNPIDEGNHNNNRVDGNGVIESEKVVSVPSSGVNANLKQIQPETIGEVILNEDLSSARMDSVTRIPIDPSVTNGELRPPFSASDSKVKINLSSTAKLELRELKRKFESELYSVRKAAKKMDGGREEMVPEFFRPVVNSSLIFNGARNNGFATRVYSGTRSLGHVPYKPNIRPFNQLRVSVVENGHGMVDSIEREKRTPKANQFYRNSEFLLANDKFPPAESNKKSKSNGKKSSGGEFGFGVGSKVYKSCSALLEKLMKHKHSWVFNSPVDVKGLGLHDYFLIIKNPMDLGTVRGRLIKYWYKSPMEFAEDVRLTFHNAMLYNPKGHDVHIMAETLLKIFEGKWPDIEMKYLRELRMAVEPDMGFPTPTSRITNPFQSPALPPLETRVFNRSESMPHPVNPKPRTLAPAPSFRAPALKKPKAKDVNKRDMTYDEKQKLSTNLQSLPPEKLDGVIQIIKKRSTALSQNDDEIEVDIDSVDTETLWELDRFVTNYKKSLSKNRRKAELANQMRANARQAAEKTAIPPQLVPPKESAAGYGNATLSLSAHGNDPAANASGSSSSSSSSSSGSSSSDSDSDSSSEESDGGHSPGT